MRVGAIGTLKTPLFEMGDAEMTPVGPVREIMACIALPGTKGEATAFRETAGEDRRLVRDRAGSEGTGDWDGEADNETGEREMEAEEGAGEAETTGVCRMLKSSQIFAHTDKNIYLTISSSLSHSLSTDVPTAELTAKTTGGEGDGCGVTSFAGRDGIVLGDSAVRIRKRDNS